MMVGPSALFSTSVSHVLLASRVIDSQPVHGQRPTAAMVLPRQQLDYDFFNRSASLWDETTRVSTNPFLLPVLAELHQIAEQATRPLIRWQKVLSLVAKKPDAFQAVNNESIAALWRLQPTRLSSYLATALDEGTLTIKSLTQDELEHINKVRQQLNPTDTGTEAIYRIPTDKGSAPLVGLLEYPGNLSITERTTFFYKQAYIALHESVHILQSSREPNWVDNHLRWAEEEATLHHVAFQLSNGDVTFYRHLRDHPDGIILGLQQYIQSIYAGNLD